MKYALIFVGYALVLWGILAVRREGATGRSAAIRDGRAEIETVVDEFIAASERTRLDMERKSAELQRLIALADDRLVRFTQMTAAPVAATVVAPVVPPTQTPAAVEMPQPAKVAISISGDGPAPETQSDPNRPRPATRGRSEAAAAYGGMDAVRRALTDRPGDRGQAASEARAATAAPATEKRERKKDRSQHAQVYALADQGHGVTEIARLTGLSKGEIQLILDLRKSR